MWKNVFQMYFMETFNKIKFNLSNNVPSQNNTNLIYGPSKDGKVEIHFYLNNDGSIGSYFPKKR